MELSVHTGGHMAPHGAVGNKRGLPVARTRDQLSLRYSISIQNSECLRILILYPAFHVVMNVYLSR